VCVVGAESTGTTTIAQQLAAHYKTAWVPEYGREYCEKKFAGADLASIPWTSVEFLHIAREQQTREDELARESNRVLICDTDALATSIWHERYMGGRLPALDEIAASHKYDLYFLTDCDIPFVQDGLRDGEHVRKWMTDRFRDELRSRKLNWHMLSGSKEKRFTEATKLIDELLL
jgi:NadR type nicotinamide-nucleotide adenylyltransferase